MDMHEPEGVVWQTAKTERNWLVYQLTPNPGGKPQKIPMHQGRMADRAKAAHMTFEEARALAEAEGLGVGYLPRSGSAMVVLDLDGVLEGDVWREDVLPGENDYLTDESYAEVSPSGTGVHVLLPRGSEWPEATIDNGVNAVGLHASGSLFIAITLDALCEGPVQAAPRLQAHVLPALLLRLEERRSEAQTASKGSGWFDRLQEAQRVALVAEVLAALPEAWLVERDRWRDVTFALRAYPELFEVWDAWSRDGGAKYDAERNALLWHGRERGQKTIGIGSLLHWGEEAGVDMRAWRRESAHEATARLAERLGRIAPELVEEAQAQPPQAYKTPEQLLAEGLANVIRYEPSLRFMHLGKRTTLTSSSKGTLLDVTLRVMFPGTIRPETEEEPNPPTVADEIMRLCHKTLQGPIADPRVPFGPVYPTRYGAQDFIEVNKLKLRVVDPSASADPKHWALVAWQRVLTQVFPVGRERAWLELWVACKAQRPWERMVAVLSVAITQGTGRGWFTDLLRALFGQDNCESLFVENLGGATAQWNDYLLALWVFVDEMGEADTSGMRGVASHRRRGYEMLKAIVDPRPGIPRRINVKHGDSYQATSFSSFFISSNHENGLPIPKGDRRFSVLQGNEAEGGETFAELVGKLIASEEALAVIWSHLHRLDLSAFNPAKALDTDAKADMVDASVSDFDVELEGLLEALAWPLMVTSQLLVALVSARGEIGKSMVKAGDGEKVAIKVEEWLQANSRPLRGGTARGSRRVGYGGRAASQRVRVLRMGEVGMKPSEVDAMTNDQVRVWLEALEADTLSNDVAGATGCRKLRSGLRVVK